MLMQKKRENIVPFRKEDETERVSLQVRKEEISLSEWTDEALMLAFGEGNEEAFEELVRRYQKSIFNYMYRMVHNWHIAEELTQEVFTALVHNADRYQPTAKFSTYVFTIASHTLSRERFRNKRRSLIFDFSAWWRSRDFSEENEIEWRKIEQQADPKANVWNNAKNAEISEAINEALKRIPAHQREAFVLKRLLDLPYEEVASILDVPIGTAKTRVVRAEKALRPFLQHFREYLEGK